ncbi:MAG: T9SS type A sorting domain-containing protein [Crocinitomicaceae bacterium]|nr:T9SS type A sorting domain-containing protein [Crocinitomicaceae bacterium]
MKKIFASLFVFASAFTFSQTCNLLNHSCNNTTGLFTSGITANAGSTLACTTGNYVLYSSSSGNPYIATDDLLINQGNAATLHFTAKKNSTYTGTAEIWVHVGGYCNFNVYTTPFNTNGWVQIATFSPTTTCTNFGPYTVPSDVIGGNLISYCIVLKNASATNWVSIDDICVSQIAGSAVPTTYTETFGTSSTGWYPSAGYIGVPYHTYKNASDAYVILGAGQGGGIDKAAYFYTGFDFCSTVSGTGIVTKEINTAGYTNGEVRISFKSRYPCSGTLSYTFDEDYTSYSPEVFIMEGPDDGTNSWIPLPVNYYFADYTWRVASYDISAYKNSNIRIKVERGGFCGTAMEAVDNIKVLDRNCAISLLSCGTISGETSPLASTDYSYTVPAVVGATYYKWFVRSEGNLYDASPYIVSGQGTQNVTINFGSLPSTGLRVLCIPYDANPAVVADACYARIGYLGVSISTSVPLTLDNVVSQNLSCNGSNDGSITLSVSGGNPASYSWLPNVSTTNSATNLAPGTYEITVTDQNSDQLIETVVITEPAAIVVAGLPDETICEGETLTTAASVTGGNSVYTYVWSPDPSIPTMLNPDFSPAFTTTYTLNIEDGNGCLGSGQFEIIVNDLPIVDLGVDQTICIGDNLILSAGIDLTNSYAWSTTENSNTISVSNPGIYSVTVTTPALCSSSDEIEIFNFANPALDLGGPYTICDGDSILLDAGSGFTSYTWSTSDVTQEIYALASGVYQVDVIDANGCSGSDDASVNAVDPPSVFLGNDVITCDDNVLIDAGAGYDSYLWSTTETTQSITVNSDGIYWVEITSGPCTNSDTIQVDIRECLEISETDYDGILVYPNPMTDILSIQNLPTNAELILYDINGKELMRSQSQTAAFTFNTGDFVHGTYVLVIKSEAKIYHWKLVK